ncbi:MAG: hypothetical protein CVV50_03850, partial [Spirochaetae bacterium HGW-Spirochaetae-6]
MRPAPLYQRQKNVRTWLKEDRILIESYLEDPVHFIVLTLEVHQERRSIESLDVRFWRSPYPDLCPLSAHIYSGLVGEVIKPGFSRTVKQLVPAVEGCVHINSLLKEAADALMQSFFYMKGDRTEGSERRR